MTEEAAVVAPTRLEAWALRRVLPPGRPVVRTGIGLRCGRPEPGRPVIVCGLAGSLTDELPPGSVVIPQRVALASGASFDCDARLVERLVAAARGLALEPSLGALVTGPSILTGPARQAWAARGFVAADMESALLAERGSPLGVVRVIVDSPGVELSALWLRPVRACLRPWLWPQALRLALTAPGYAMVAARVAARVLAAPAS